jgi:tRNA(Arg) A34 adenosine deaminase TadA
MLERAIELAVENVGVGGHPFGAVVAIGGSVVAEGTNLAVQDNDPTSHAELVAIRAACQRLGTLDLAGGVVFASAEPCPMCQAAALLAGVSKMYYAATSEMSAAVGFDARFVGSELAIPFDQRSVPVIHIPTESASRPLETWSDLQDPIR